METGIELHASTLTVTESHVPNGHTYNYKTARDIVNLVDVNESIAEAAASLRFNAGKRKKSRKLTVDAVVAATALAVAKTVPSRPVILTGDPHDMRLLLSNNPTVKIVRV